MNLNENNKNSVELAATILYIEEAPIDISGYSIDYLKITLELKKREIFNQVAKKNNWTNRDGNIIFVDKNEIYIYESPNFRNDKNTAFSNDVTVVATYYPPTPENIKIMRMSSEYTELNFSLKK